MVKMVMKMVVKMVVKMKNGKSERVLEGVFVPAGRRRKWYLTQGKRLRIFFLSYTCSAIHDGGCSGGSTLKASPIRVHGADLGSASEISTLPVGELLLVGPSGVESRRQKTYRVGNPEYKYVMPLRTGILSYYVLQKILWITHSIRNESISPSPLRQ